LNQSTQITIATLTLPTDERTARNLGMSCQVFCWFIKPQNSKN